MKIKFPISLKQILLFSFLIILVLGVSTALVSGLVRNDDRIKAEENNFALNGRTAQTVESSFENIQGNSYVLFEAFETTDSVIQQDKLADSFFRSNPDVLFISSPQTGLLFSPEGADFEDAVEDFLESPQAASVISNDSPDQSAVYYNASAIFDCPSIIFIYKYGPLNAVNTGIVGLNTEFLAELMATGSNNTTILVDSNANILINPDFASTEKVRNDFLDIIKVLLNNPQESNAQNQDKETGVFTAVHQIKDDLFVITTISEQSVYAVINRTTYRIILFSLAVLFVAIILIRLFSNSITNPIKELVAASSKIEHGDGCTYLLIYSNQLNCTLNGRMASSK